MQFEELSKKYRNIHYPPKADCRKCHGEGEFANSKTGRVQPCICIYVSHDVCDEVGRLIGGAAKKILDEELGNNNGGEPAQKEE